MRSGNRLLYYICNVADRSRIRSGLRSSDSPRSTDHPDAFESGILGCVQPVGCQQNRHWPARSDACPESCGSWRTRTNAAALVRRRHLNFHLGQKREQPFLNLKPKLRHPVLEGSIHRGFRMIVLITSSCCLGGRNPHLLLPLSCADKSH